MHKTVDVGEINPKETKESKLEYYILNKGIFNLQKLIFFDKISN